MAMLFSSRGAAGRCVKFIKRFASAAADAAGVEVIHFGLDPAKPSAERLRLLCPAFSAVLFPVSLFPVAKQYWQHTGEGVSSRRAEFCRDLLKSGLLCLDRDLVASPSPRRCKGPKRYQTMKMEAEKSPTRLADMAVLQQAGEAQELSRFVEERFGRNLDVSFVEPAKSAIRRRIAGTLRSNEELGTAPAPEVVSDGRGIINLQEHDVYLYPCGMNAIFNTHRMLMAARGSFKTVIFGFPYVDTLKLHQKFGPGCQFYGRGSSADLNELESRLGEGDKFLALFCEFPGNPLLTCPDLARIRRLADRYDFAVVVDETIGTFANINVLPFADVVVSSLTKIFSGDCNVMGGSAVLNPNSRYYAKLKDAALSLYEDTYWAEDIIFMERNSRDFVHRIERIDANAEAICHLLLAHASVKKVYYPKHNQCRPNYDMCRLPNGGYGGLLSITFHHRAQAVAFYDAIETAKGPSLGTNFTLASPYVLLAHYQELDWASSLGVDPNLIRISVGLEETSQVVAIFQAALEAAETATCS